MIIKQFDVKAKEIKMIGEKVVHSVFGEGIIKEVKDGSKNYQKYITVEFKIGDKKFIFPDIFEKILVTDNEVLKSEIKIAFDNIKAEQEKERIEKEKEKARIEFEKAEAERILWEKKQAKRTHINTTVISKDLIKGHVYGTAAKDIYEACCDAFDWNKYESKCFGWQTPNYSEIATKEGYSVWFLAHSNWTDSDTADVKNQISETYMEQWWAESDHPNATTRKRLIFAKKDNHYIFLGVFKFIGKERTEMRDSKIYHIERFDLISEKYPE